MWLAINDFVCLLGRGAKWRTLGWGSKWNLFPRGGGRPGGANKRVAPKRVKKQGRQRKKLVFKKWERQKREKRGRGRGTAIKMNGSIGAPMLQNLLHISPWFLSAVRVCVYVFSVKPSAHYTIGLLSDQKLANQMPNITIVSWRHNGSASRILS